MILKTISKENYKDFLTRQEKKNFLQSSYAASKMEADGWKIEYLQGLENNTVQVTCMVATLPLLRSFRYAYIPRGFFIDYKDKATLNSFTVLLKKHLRKQRVIYLEIDPDIILQERDKNGDIVPHGINNQEIVDNLLACGYIQMPLERGSDIGSHQCRWTSGIDLSKKTIDQIFSEFSSQTRNDIRNAQKYGVKVRTLKPSELSILDHMEQEAGERHHFEAVSLETYEKMYKFYDGHAKAVYAYLDLSDYEKTVVTERKKTEAEIQELKIFLKENPNSKKKQKRLKVADEYYTSLKKKEDQISQQKELYGNELPLASSMFIKYGKTVTYLYSGSDYKQRVYRGPYAIQWHMIKESVEEGYEYYDMYGISGYFEKGQEGHGVFDFKRGFNAHVKEFIGRYHLVIHPILYMLHKRIHKNI